MAKTMRLILFMFVNANKLVEYNAYKRIDMLFILKMLYPCRGESIIEADEQSPKCRVSKNVIPKIT